MQKQKWKKTQHNIFNDYWKIKNFISFSMVIDLSFDNLSWGIKIIFISILFIYNKDILFILINYLLL